ncbi:hypothetical protein ACHAPT_003216 [Fusarium lateritium]
MVDLAPYFDDPSAFLSETVAPIVIQHHEGVALSIGFLTQLMEKANNGKLPLESFQRLYRTIAKSVVASTDFAKVQSHASLNQSAKRLRYGGTTEQLRHEVAISTTGSRLSTFLSGLTMADTEADNLVASFISKLTTNCPRLQATELHSLWIPFLRKIHTTLNFSDMSTSELERYRQLFTTFLKAYLDKYVGLEPVYDGNLTRPLVSCSCIDCEHLNDFLGDPTREVGRFTVNKQRRAHLHQKLTGARIDCAHETERVGSPQTPVVTKTFGQVEGQRQSWAARRTEATMELVRFKQENLKKLLGDEYTAIVNMNRILAAGTTARQSLAETGQAGSSRGPVAGEKRRLSSYGGVDIIDLTSD